MPSDKFHFDVATVLSQGRRAHQEDAIASEFSEATDVGFVVLGDGMGGHTSGEIASKIVVSEVFEALQQRSADPELLESRIQDILHSAAAKANTRIGEYTQSCPETQGMGTTLLSPVIVKDNLYWLSIGDSPLYIFRKNNLFQLNHIHTLQNQLETLIAQGVLSQRDVIEADANCLTSAVIGGEIPQIDCCDAPVKLLDQDILITSSDGLQFLTDQHICNILAQVQHESSACIGQALMSEIVALNDPNQDNIAFCIVKFERQVEFQKDIFESDHECFSHASMIGSRQSTYPLHISDYAPKGNQL